MRTSSTSRKRINNLTYLLTIIFSFFVHPLSATPISDGWSARVWTTEWSPMHGNIQIIPDPEDIWARDGGTIYDPVSVMPNDLYSGLGRPTVTNSGQVIPYTHYVDGSADNCTDNSKGTASTPRCTWPTGDTLSAGDVVVIATPNGDMVDYQSSTKVVGSADKPIFFWGICQGDYNSRQKGNGCPAITSSLVTKHAFHAEHVIWDGFRMDGIRPLIGNNSFTPPDSNYVAMRNFRVHNVATRNGFGLKGSHFVLYRVRADHNQGQDRHGITPGPTNYFWLLQSELDHNGGDGIQWCHGIGGCTDGNGTSHAKYIYIDQVDGHGNRENAIDTKYTEHAIFSRNRIWSHIHAPKDDPWCFDDDPQGRHQYDPSCPTWSSGSAGDGIVTGSDGHSRDIWYLYNEFIDNRNAVRVEDGVGGHFIGNKFLRGNKSNATLDSYLDPDTVSHGIHTSGEANQLRVYGNLFVNLDHGLSGTKVDTSFVARNNIFYNIQIPFDVGGTEECITNTIFENNLVYNESGSAEFAICTNNGEIVTQTADLNGIGFANSVPVGNIWGAPLFLNPQAGDYRLTTSSPAINAGGDWQRTLDSILNSDSGVTNLSLTADFDGNLLPGAGNIDIGPYQESEGTSPVTSEPPPPPENFGVTEIIKN